MNIANSFIIFSAAREGREGNENDAQHAIAREYLRNASIPFIEVNGVYKGIAERSLLATVTKPEDRAYILATAKAFDQESVLAVDGARQARLETTDGTLIARLGAFKLVDSIEGRDAYTELDGKFYACDGVLI